MSGFTEDEILDNFKDELKEYAAIKECATNEIMDELRLRYNGY